ncbi:MAG: isoleucine-tRNA ligase [Bathelium mastoideum]|nr:MAG: isoleucine-tRNA ligase [Bathelium mastoideum]
MLKPSCLYRAPTTWSSTLKLPRSKFPPRPIPTERPTHLHQCTDDFYAGQSERRSKHKLFVLHDGPPYANGSLHIGHALNKILKDLICRFEVSQGKRVCFVPGWDCHGLPIEIKALQLQKRLDSGKKHAPAGDAGTSNAVAIRGAARQLATRTIKEQKASFREWAVMGDWDHAYRTMDKDFELRQLRIFKEMVEKGFIYRQNKPVYWSPSSHTALAEAELEYDENHTSTAAFIKFPLVELPRKLWHLKAKISRFYAVIWTTTPWTLPANKAIAVHQDLEYTVIAMADEKEPTKSTMLLVGKDRLDTILSHMPETATPSIVVDSILGSELIGETKYINVLQGSQSEPQPFLHAPFVASSSGSGLVHMAPGHGLEDYDICVQNDIETFAPVDDKGCFTRNAMPDLPNYLDGKSVLGEGGTAVLSYLERFSKVLGESRGLVLASHQLQHKYPTDWRTKQPVIIRATEQWFANVENIKSDAIHALDGVEFVPESGKNRMLSFVKGRSQWCVSRQRAWGVPIPALFRQTSTGMKAIMTGETIDHILKVIEERGIDAWWTDKEDDSAWVPPGFDGEFVRGKDTMDVWFDSGTTWTTLSSNGDEGCPADVYIEGTDQHRGWFQSSLLTFVAHQSSQTSHTSTPRAPFKKLITHGFTLDQHGRKMSKSIGNVISPQQIMDGSLLPPLRQKNNKGNKKSEQVASLTYDAMGPDALRLWVAGSDYTKDVIVGQAGLLAVHQSLHKYRTTFKWLLGVLYDYEQREHPPTFCLMDRIALYQLSLTCHEVHASYSAYAFFKVVSAINRFINHDLSAFYFETLKDRLYTGHASDRYAAQGVLLQILDSLVSMLGPVTPLLIQETWAYTPPALKGILEHPWHKNWTSPEHQQDRELEQTIAHLTAAHTAVKSACEAARSAKQIGSNLESQVTLVIPESVETPLKQISSEDLASVFVTSGASVTVGLSDGPIPDDAQTKAWQYEESIELDGRALGSAIVSPAKGCKCPRCWRYVAPEPEKLCQRCGDVVKDLGVDVP